MDSFYRSSFKFFWQTPKKIFHFCKWSLGRSRAFKVIILLSIESAYTTSYKLVIVTLFLSRTVSEILQVFCAPDPTPIQPQFWGCSRCIRWPMLGVSQSEGLKLFGREVIFEVFQLVWKTYLNVTHRQTDRRTDNIRSHNRVLHSIAR